MKEIPVEEIKDQFPKEWKRFQAQLQGSRKPGLSLAQIEELHRESRELWRETFVLPTAQDRPFLTECEILWDEDWSPIFNQILELQPRKGAHYHEKRLVECLERARTGGGGQSLYDEIYDVVSAHPFVKKHAKKIQAFKKKLDVLAKTYSFDYDDVIWDGG